MSPEETIRNEHCKNVADLPYSELCCLVAAIASWELGEVPVCRLGVSALISQVEGIVSLDSHLLRLSRKGFLEPVGRDENASVYYQPTPRGIEKVRRLRSPAYIPGLRGCLQEPAEVAAQVA